MIRECTLKDISDGRTYDVNDMVKADTWNCQGCHKCCTGMGTSIILDPYDVWLLKTNLNCSFQELLNKGNIELNMVDGLILPNLKMGEGDICSFLNEEGRCTIHHIRPSICRLFPLGRIYEGEGFKYFLQKNQCVKENLTKIKVKKWIDVDNIEDNQKFILKWHSFIRYVGDRIISLKKDKQSESINDIAMFVLNSFYIADINLSEGDMSLIYDMIINRIEKATKIIDETFS